MVTNLLRKLQLASAHPIIQTVLALLVFGGSVGSFTLTAYADQYVNGGVAWGPDLPYIEHTDLNPLGVNVFLEKEADFSKVEHTLQMVRDGGFRWVRQTFPWNDIEIHAKGDYIDRRDPNHPVDAWAKYDRIVDACLRYGLEIIARLDAPPVWARIPGDDVNAYPKGPPANYKDYGDFVEAVARRYRGRIRYYQIWNEPNLVGEWGGHPVNPEEYTALLKEAYTRIKAVDPQAVVITAALAPTAEQTVANLNDVLFLEGMYRAGAARYFDILSTMLYGLGQPPDSRRTDLKYLNFSRPILLRRVMEKYGDAAKPIWISEYSWISLPPGWEEECKQRTDNPCGQNIWGQSVDEQTQARWLVEGYRRAQAEWPWMGVMCVWYFREPDPHPEQPANYFAIVRPDFTPRPAYEALKEYSRLMPLAGVGRHRGDSPAVTYETAETAPLPQGRANSLLPYTATIRFAGNRVDADLTLYTTATVSVDGGPQRPIVPSAGGPAPVRTQVTLADGLPDGPHTVTIHLQMPAGASPSATLAGFTVVRNMPLWDAWGFPALYVLSGMLALASAALGAASIGRWAGAVLNRPVGRYSAETRETARNGAVVVGMALLGLLYYLADSRPLIGAALAAWWVLALLKPSTGLAAVAFTIPFFWQPKQIGQQKFPLAETLLLLVFAAVLARYALGYLVPGLAVRLGIEPRRGVRRRDHRHDAPDAPDALVENEAPAGESTTPAHPADNRRDPHDELAPPRWPPRPPITGVSMHTGSEVKEHARQTGTGVRQQPPPAQPALHMATAAPAAVTVRPRRAGLLRSIADRFADWSRRDPFAPTAVALLAIGTLSLLTLADPTFARDSARAYRWVIVEPVLFYFLLTDAVDSRRGLLRVADFFVAGAVLVSLVGLWQFVRDTGTLDVQGVSRVVGVYQHPNNLALYLGRVVPLAACLALYLPWGWRRVIYALVTVPLAAALVLTFSRGAWLGVLAAMLVSGAVGLSRRQGQPEAPDTRTGTKAPLPAHRVRVVGAAPALVLAGAILLGLAALAAMPQLRERVLNLGSGSLRVMHWQSAARMIADHPIFGIGLDQYLNQFQARSIIADPEQCVRMYTAHPHHYIVDSAQCQEFYTAHPHNLILDYWLSLGIMGLLVLVWVLWRYFRVALVTVRRAGAGATPDPTVRALTIGLLAGMVDFLVHGMVDNSYFLMDLAMIFWLSCGLLQLAGAGPEQRMAQAQQARKSAGSPR